MQKKVNIPKGKPAENNCIKLKTLSNTINVTIYFIACIN